MAFESMVEKRIEDDGSVSEVMTAVDPGDFEGDRGARCVMSRKSDGTYVVESIEYLTPIRRPIIPRHETKHHENVARNRNKT